jgi:hypothetical protein
MSPIEITVVAVIFVFTTLLLPVMQSLVGDEVKGWLPHITRAIVAAAVRRLPRERRARYQQEWLAELDAYSERRLTAIIHACGFWRAAVAIRSALREEQVPLGHRVAAGLLLLFFAPLLAAIAFAIKIESRGPAFVLCYITEGERVVHRQWMFRTVPDGAYRKPLRERLLEHGVSPYKTITTRVGWVLQRSSLHTLPFLVNVVMADQRLPWRESLCEMRAMVGRARRIADRRISSRRRSST